MATLADYGPEVRAEVKQVREVVATLHEQLIKWKDRKSTRLNSSH